MLPLDGHMFLLSSRIVALAKLIAQIIRLRAQFPDYPIKSIRLDNAGEFFPRAFDDFCMSLGVTIEHPVTHVHTQNSLAESFIKRLQLVVRSLLMRTKLSVFTWRHAILHVVALVRIGPSAYHKHSPLQLAFDQPSNISHLRVFDCATYVPVAPPQRTKMGSQ